MAPIDGTEGLETGGSVIEKQLNALEQIMLQRPDLLDQLNIGALDHGIGTRPEADRCACIQEKEKALGYHGPDVIATFGKAQTSD
jgi:hypothetical protein